MGGTKPCNSFITIKYGDNETRIFNPDCSMKQLIDCIRKTCNYPTRELAVVGESYTVHEEITVTDVIKLQENMENGRSMFYDRGLYILLSLQRKGEQWEYEALLDEEYLSPALKEKLHELNNPKAEQRRPTRVSKSKPPSRNASRKTSVARKK